MQQMSQNLIFYQPLIASPSIYEIAGCIFLQFLHNGAQRTKYDIFHIKCEKIQNHRQKRQIRP